MKRLGRLSVVCLGLWLPLLLLLLRSPAPALGIHCYSYEIHPKMNNQFRYALFAVFLTVWVMFYLKVLRHNVELFLAALCPTLLTFIISSRFTEMKIPVKTPS